MSTVLRPRTAKLRIAIVALALGVGTIIASAIAAFLLGIGFSAVNSKAHFVNVSSETSAWLGIIAIVYGILAGLVIGPIVSWGYVAKRLNISRRKFLVVIIGLLAVIPGIEYSVFHSPAMVGAENKLNIEAVSVDGKLIILAVRRTDSSVLYLVERNTGQARLLVQSGENYQDGAKFSPDGKRIIFISRKQSDSPSRIMLCNVDGSGLHPISSGGDDDYAAMFSRAGRTIYFARPSSLGRYVRDFDIYSVKVDGSDLKRVTENKFKADEETYLLFPESISDDETKLLLEADTNVGDRLVVDPLLDQNQAPETITPKIPNGPEHPVLAHACFALGGKKILFMAASQGAKGFDYDIYSLDRETYNLQKLTSVGGYASDFQLSPDGRVAAYFTWTLSRLNSVPINPELQIFDVETKTASTVRIIGLPSDR